MFIVKAILIYWVVGAILTFVVLMLGLFAIWIDDKRQDRRFSRYVDEEWRKFQL